MTESGGSLPKNFVIMVFRKLSGAIKVLQYFDGKYKQYASSIPNLFKFIKIYVCNSMLICALK